MDRRLPLNGDWMVRIRWRSLHNYPTSIEFQVPDARSFPHAVSDEAVTAGDGTQERDERQGEQDAVHPLHAGEKGGGAG